MSSPEPEAEITSSWSEIPDIVLTEIFSQLQIFDRYHASLVCRNWSQGFNSPSLWRHVAVFFLGVPSRMQNFEISCNRRIPVFHDRCALKFSSQFGKHLKVLILVFHPIYRCRGASVQGQIEKFLNILTTAGCSLKELAIIGYLDPHVCYPRDRENIIKAFIEFLLYQTELEFIDFRPFDEDTRLLETVVSTCGTTLKSMNAVLFFEPGSCIQETYYQLLHKLPNLETIKLSFVSVDKVAFKILLTCCPYLNIIDIDAHCTELFPEPPIEAEDWKQACQIRPKLQVRVEAILPRFLSKLPIMLPLFMPLVALELKFTWGTIYEENWDLEQVFRYIIKSFSETLVAFTFKDSISGDLAVDLHQSIRSLILSCSKLSYLELKAEVSLNTVEEICRLQKDKKIDIEKLKIQSGSFNREEFDKLENIVLTYSDILKTHDWEFTSPKHTKFNLSEIYQQ